MNFKDYDAQQLNQINKALEEGNEYIELLNPNLDARIFRAFRQIAKDFEYTEPTLKKIVAKANEGIDITKIIPQMYKNDINLAFRIIQKYDKEMIDKFYSEDMTDQKRELMYDDKEFLLDYKKYQLRELEFLALNPLEELKENIVENNYTAEQLEFIAEMFYNNKLHNEILDSKYEVLQMKLINYFLENNLNLEQIDEYSNTEVESYIELIERNYDISKIYDKNYSLQILSFICDCLEQEKNPEKYLNTLLKLNIPESQTYITLVLGPFNKNTINSFLKNYKELKKSSTLVYATRILEDISMHNFYREKNKDASALFTPGYTFNQLGILSEGFRYNINLGQYCTPEYSEEQMKYMLSLLRSELDITTICNPNYSVEDMKRISFYNNKGIYFDTLEEYYKNYTRDKNNDFKSFIEISSQINEYVHDNSSFVLVNALVKYNKTHEYQVDIETILESKAHRVFEEFFDDLGKNLDVNTIWQKDFNAAQREEIRKGLASGIDVKKYLNSNLSGKEMKEIRKKLEKGETLDEKINNYKTESNEEKQPEIKRTTGYLR